MGQDAGVGGARATSFPLGAPPPVLPQLQELEQPGPSPVPLSTELVSGVTWWGRGFSGPGNVPLA